MLSFYTLPSTVINNPHHSRLAAAFQYYTVPGATPLIELMGDALILAHNTCAHALAAWFPCASSFPAPVVCRATALVYAHNACAHAYAACAIVDCMVYGATLLPCTSVPVPCRGHDVFNMLDIFQNVEVRIRGCMGWRVPGYHAMGS